MPVELEDEPTNTGLASLEDAFGSRLDQIKADISNDEKGRADDSPQESPAQKEQPNPVENKSLEPKKASAKPEVKTPPKEDKPDPKAAQVAAQVEKDKRRAKDIPLDEREYLLANEVKKLELVTGLKKQIEDLKAELDPTKLKVGELEQSVAQKQQLESEIEALRKEKEDILKEKQELNHKVSAYDVRQTSEYKTSVLDPWNKNIIGTNEQGKESGILGLGITPDQEATLQAIIQRGGKTHLINFLNEFPGDENSVMRDDIRALYRDGKALVTKDAEYAAKGPEALKEINERATKAEREKAENVRKERNGYFGEVDASATQAFPFLADEALSGETKTAKEKMQSFDWSQLSAKDQAVVTHQYFHAPLIFRAQGQHIAHLNGELEKIKSEHAESDLKKDAEIERLNERLGNQAGTRINAGTGRNRGDDGKFVSTGEITNVEQGFNKFLEQAKRGN